MKDFLNWFKAGTKMKRWLLVMLVGIVLVCYGIANLLTTNKIDNVLGLAKIIISFVIGFTFIVISIVYMQKRTLELLVKETDTRNMEEKGEVSTLIFNKKVYNQGPKVVVIGGGSGLNTVLRGLKNYTDNITAIVTVSNYGDPNINKKDGLLDDIKDSIISLSANEEKVEKLLNYRIKEDGKRSTRFSDVYFNSLKDIIGDFPRSIEESTYILNMTGRVLPATLDSVSICAELDDGTVVESKEKIPEVVESRLSKINRVYLYPTNSRMAPGVKEAIREADAIVIGPGSLYTNVIPNLLVPGIAKEIKESKAYKIYVSNIMTEPGQTDNFGLSDHIKAIIDHAGEGIINYCIYDTGEIIPEYIRKYNEEGCDLVEQDVSNVKGMGIRLIQRNLSTIDKDAIKHNSDAIATTIIELICDEMRFNDMQNDAQYIMLDDRVKNINKKLKEEAKEEKANRESINKFKSNGKKSKFFEKYNDRIESIKTSQKGKNKKLGKHSANIKSDSKKVEEKKKVETETKPKEAVYNKELLDAINQMRKEKRRK